MESTSELIQRLADSGTAEEKTAALSKLRHAADEQAGALIIGNVKKLFTLLEGLIHDSASGLSVQAIELISALVCGNDPEITAYATKLVPILVASLGTDQSRLCSAIQECVLRYLKKTDNCDSVLVALNRNGIESGDMRTQQNAASALAELSRRHPSLVDDKKHFTELSRTLQGILSLSSRTSGDDKRPFADSLVSLTQTHPSVHRTVRGLPDPLRSEYRKVLSAAGIEISDNVPDLGKAYQDIDSALVAEITKKFGEAPSVVEHKTKPREAEIVCGVAFGIIPERLVKDLNPAANWKQRAGAIEELEEIVSQEYNRPRIEPNLSGLFQYLVGLLNDPNYKVSVTTLQIISIIHKAHMA